MKHEKGKMRGFQTKESDSYSVKYERLRAIIAGAATLPKPNGRSLILFNLMQA
jgi:hypothetical protein